MAKGISHRQWVIRRVDCRNEDGQIDDNVFRATVENEAVLNVHLMERLGMAVVCSPIREEMADGSWVTTGYGFQTATVPAIPHPDAPPRRRPVLVTRPMVGPGGEEEDVPSSKWEERLASGWEWDDEYEGETEVDVSAGVEA